MIKRPECLHIPALYDNQSAELLWQEVTEADGYDLDSQYDDGNGQSLVWESLYTGPARREPGPGQGLTWQNLDGTYQSWHLFERDDMTWEDFHYKPQGGYVWNEIDSRQLSYLAFEKRDQTWRDLDFRLNNGLTWDHIHVRWKNWLEWELKNLTWSYLESATDDGYHRAHTIHVPQGTKNAYFRVRAYKDDENSDHLSTDLIPVKSYFDREDETEWEAAQGHRYHVQLDAVGIHDFGTSPLIIRYDPAILELEDFTAHHICPSTLPGAVKEAYLEILSHEQGEIKFICIRVIPEEQGWSGLVTLMRFTAFQDGMARVTIQ